MGDIRRMLDTKTEATRHSCCTQIVPLTDPLTAQRLMGHKDRRSTDNYYHAYSEILPDVVQRMNGNVVDLKVKERQRMKPSNFKEIMAEGVGFEPTGRVNAQRFSRPPLSAAQPSLRLTYSTVCHSRFQEA